MLLAWMPGFAQALGQCTLMIHQAHKDIIDSEIPVKKQNYQKAKMMDTSL